MLRIGFAFVYSCCIRGRLPPCRLSMPMSHFLEKLLARSTLWLFLAGEMFFIVSCALGMAAGIGIGDDTIYKTEACRAFLGQAYIPLAILAAILLLASLA